MDALPRPPHPAPTEDRRPPGAPPPAPPVPPATAPHGRPTPAAPALWGLGRPTPSAAAAAVALAAPRPNDRPRPTRVLAVAASTGGPAALGEFLAALPGRLAVPVLVTQHMPPDFTALLVERLTATGGRPCAEARDGEPLRAGGVYVAPGDRHLRVERRGPAVVVRLTAEPPVHGCRPAADPMFESVAAAYGAGALAVVLTGMGYDGRDGAAAVVRAGGRVLAQDEASSVVWGMPGAVVQAGLASLVRPVRQLAAYAAECCAAGGARHHG